MLLLATFAHVFCYQLFFVMKEQQDESEGQEKKYIFK